MIERLQDARHEDAESQEELRQEKDSRQGSHETELRSLQAPQRQKVGDLGREEE